MKVAEANARLSALLDGSADVATHIQASDLPTLQAAGGNVSNVAGARTGYYHINFEGILGNEASKWSRDIDSVHTATLPFTRWLCGPGDFTPGGFINRQPETFYTQNSTNSAASVMRTASACPTTAF